MSNNELPVSVIIPSYNSSEFLEKCIESINANQKPDEILIIDDCSTDQSYDLALLLAQTHTNIRVLKTEKNSGAAGARKLGFSNARNEFVAIVDSDDIIEENAIEDAFSKIDPSVDLCIWDLWRLAEDGSCWRHGANPLQFPIKGEDAILMCLDAWRIHPLGVARKSIYLKAYEDFNIDSMNSDELITRLIFMNARSIVGSQKKYFYRVNKNSTTQKLSDKHLSVLRSNYWLIELALKVKDGPVNSVLKNSVASAFSTWRNRSSFTVENVYREIYVYVLKIGSNRNLLFKLMRFPKHFAGFSILVVVSLYGRIRYKLQRTEAY